MALITAKNQDIRKFLSSPPLTFDKFKPSFTSTPVVNSAKLLRKQRKQLISDDDNKQLILDAGQKDVGMSYCNDCGMLYSADVQKDIKAHDDFHNRFIETKSFKITPSIKENWKRYGFINVTTNHVDGTLYKVENKTRSAIKNKFESIIEDFVDPQLGICPDVPIFEKNRNQSGFIFVTNSTNKAYNFIGAVVLTEKVLAGKLMPMNKIYKEQYGFIAVERLWVHPLLRRKKLATNILDTIRKIYSKEKELGRTRVAFVEPNNVCIEFAKNYLDEKYKKRYIIYEPQEMSKLNELSMKVKKDEKEEKKLTEVASSRPQKRQRLKDDDKENAAVKKTRSQTETMKQPSNKKFKIIKSNEKITNKDPAVQELIPTLIIDDEDNPSELELSTELF